MSNETWCKGHWPETATYNKCLMYWLHLQYVSTTFTKGNNFCNFLLAYLGNKTLPKGDQGHEEKILHPKEHSSCFYGLVCNWKGG